MAKETDTPKDEGLQGNEKIEEAILELQKEPTPELLAHVLTVIRRRMKEGVDTDLDDVATSISSKITAAEILDTGKF